MCDWTMKEFYTLADADHTIKNCVKKVFISNESSYSDCISVIQKGHNAIIIKDYNSGIKPSVVEFERRIWVGTNFSIECFDLYLNRIKSIHTLTPVFEFICNKTYKLIIVICEIDIFCLNSKGNIVWHKALSDIITDYHMQNNNVLTYSLFEGGTFSINIKNSEFV